MELKSLKFNITTDNGSEMDVEAFGTDPWASKIDRFEILSPGDNRYRILPFRDESTYNWICDRFDDWLSHPDQDRCEDCGMTRAEVGDLFNNEDNVYEHRCEDCNAAYIDDSHPSMTAEERNPGLTAESKQR